MKTVIILRACSGAGKSTFAEFFKSTHKNATTICCADNYFMQDGEYQFDAKKLGAAHSFCKKTFLSALEQNIPTVIVANTNTKTQDFLYYIDLANEFGYLVFSLVVENRHENKNIHNVPFEVLNKQKENIINSLRL